MRKRRVYAPKKHFVWKFEREAESKRLSQRFLSFLNAPVGIWLLSTVAVGLISLGYSKLQRAQKLEAHNRAIASKLDQEISNRITDFQRRIIT